MVSDVSATCFLSPPKHVVRICFWRHGQIPFILWNHWLWLFPTLLSYLPADGHVGCFSLAHFPHSVMYIRARPLCPRVKVSLGHKRRSKWLSQAHRHFCFKETLAFYPLTERAFVSPYCATNFLNKNIEWMNGPPKKKEKNVKLTMCVTPGI